MKKSKMEGEFHVIRRVERRVGGGVLEGEEKSFLIEEISRGNEGAKILPLEKEIEG